MREPQITRTGKISTITAAVVDTNALTVQDRDFTVAGDFDDMTKAEKAIVKANLLEPHEAIAKVKKIEVYNELRVMSMADWIKYSHVQDERTSKVQEPTDMAPVEE